MALKDTPATPENVVSLHENLTDSIAAGDAVRRREGDPVVGRSLARQRP